MAMLRSGPRLVAVLGPTKPGKTHLAIARMLDHHTGMIGLPLRLRPRVSTLSYTGYKKVTRLPPRRALVAFNMADVFSLAELVRRQRGGTAVVMGALSPRARNAQVGMFQAGEVDYLVATDAIGMGL